MTPTAPRFCFCTLAMGERYRDHALELSKDLAKYAPTTPLVILTDKPQKFSHYPQITVFKHQQQSLGCYHDKRFAIKEALSLFPSCIFVDADVRILAPIPPDLQFQPGITARSCANAIKHHQALIGAQPHPHKVKNIATVNQIASKLDLNIADSNIQFVQEMLFAVTRQEGREQDFIKYWGKIAHYCELNGFYAAEGYAIGLAAAKVDMPVRWDAMASINYFKDWVEKQKIKKGQAQAEEKLVYFQQHNKIEHKQHSFLNKLTNKILKKVGFYYRLCLLKMRTITNFDFYYR